MIDLRAYGAVGDGAADDTTAFQSAILAATTACTELYIPSGTYRVTAPLSVDPHRVSVRGDGPQCSVIVPQLPAGQYALTLGWDAAMAGADRPGPYAALQGVGFLGTVGAGQPNCLHIVGSGASPHASCLTVRDVSIKGFDTQVTLGDHTYLIAFDRVFFVAAHTYGVALDDQATAGENISFHSCLFSDSPGTGLYVNKSGASIFVDKCSFDYLKRAIWQRAGKVSITASHFETDNTYGPGGEFILLARNGSVNLPMLTLTDCDLYDAWTGYDCFLRLAGDYGTNGLRLTNPYVVRAMSATPYLIRDDGPYASSVVVSGAWYGRQDFPTPKMRKQNGTDLVLTPAATIVV